MRINNLRHLPNTHGFPFTAVLKDGTRVRCRVIKKPDGCYAVDGVAFESILGWTD